MASVKFTDAGISPIVKNHFTDNERLSVAFNRKNIAMATVQRKKAGGDEYVQPIDYAIPGGGSPSFSTAQSGYKSSKYGKFRMARAKHYIVPILDNESVMATEKDADAFAPLIKELDRGFRAEGDHLESRFFRERGGVRGRIDATTTIGTAVAKLTDRADTYLFAPDQVVRLYSASTGVAPETGTLTVLSTDPANATVTFTGNITAGVATAAVGMYIAVATDYDNEILGLRDWLPSDRSGLATPFQGVNRSLNATILAGNYIDGTGGNLKELVIDALAATADAGGMANKIFLNTYRLASLVKLLEGNVTYSRIDEKVSPRIGFSGIRATFGEQDVTIYGTRNVPFNDMYVLDWSTWFMHSPGEIPMFLLKDHGHNSIVTPSPTEDGWECRIGYYAQLACSFPGANARVKLA